MPNKIFRISIFLFIFVFGILYFFTNDLEDIPTTRSQGEDKALNRSNGKIKKMASDLNELEALSIENFKDAPTVRNSTDATLPSNKQSKSIQQNRFFNEEGTLNIKNINNALTLNDSEFFDLMKDLSNDTNEATIIRQQNLASTLLNIEQLNNYNYEQSCGGGICVIKVPYVEKNSLKSLGNELATRIKTGVSFSRQIINENGTNEFRMIFDANPESKGELVLSSGIQLGIE